MRKLSLVFLSFLSVFTVSAIAFSASPLQPVIHCHTPDPTRDKPQSKVWYAQGSWWAWLPYGEQGSRVWKRDSGGDWQSQVHLEEALAGLPARADVWAQGPRTVAALLSGKNLAVAALRWDAIQERYELEKKSLSWQENAAVETVTLAREPGGDFWISYPLDLENSRKVVARRVSSDLSSLGKKITLAAGLYKDEICAITSFDSGIGVMWSDQAREAVFFRRHIRTDPDSAWLPAETVSSGNKTADDHINFCVPPQGSGPRLIAATKTSLDSLGEPLLSLRVNSRGRTWMSVPFARLTKRDHPTRPIVLWYKNRPVVIYSSYGPSSKQQHPNRVLIQSFSTDSLKPAKASTELIPPTEGLNNVTGPKKAPKEGPVLILASDREGRVFEALISDITVGIQD